MVQLLKAQQAEEKDVVRALVTACSKEQDPAGMSLIKSRSSRAVSMLREGMRWKVGSLLLHQLLD